MKVLQRHKTLSLLMLGLMWAAPVWAHKSMPARRLMLQLDAQGMAVIVEHSVGGAEAQLLAATFDVDRNGVFSDTENEALAQALVAKGLMGLAFYVGEEKLKIMRVTPRLQDASLQSTTLVAVGLVELSVPAHMEATADLSVAVDKSTAPLLFMVQALDNYRVLSARGLKLAGDGRGFRDAARIMPGDTLNIRISKLWQPQP